MAGDVTQNGSTAWRRHFADTPPFFVASEDKLVFPDSPSATTGIRDLPRWIQSIELQWGSDLRVDPLTPNLALMAASFHELLVSPAGERTDEHGFFTGIAEYRQGR